MITGQDIVIISSTGWKHVWEGNHEIATRLAQAGNRVFYIEHMGFRGPSLRKLTRALGYPVRWLKRARSLGADAAIEGLYVCTPLVLPPFGSRMQCWINRVLLVPMVARACRRLGLRDPVILNYLPTDSASDLIDLMRSDLKALISLHVTAYEEIVKDVRRLRASEIPLLRGSDLVLTQGPVIARWCRQFNGNVHEMTHGVDMESFPLTGDAHPEIAALKRPVIGYVGGMHDALDYDLVNAMTALRPEWHWVFVGLQRGGPMIQQRANVHMPGWIPHGELHRYVRAFDVCIIPYVESAASDHVFPTKLYEYLAAGRPVVSTRMPLVIAIQREHPVFVTAPAAAPLFLEAVESAMLQNSEADARDRRALAALNDWELRIETLSSFIELAIAGREGSKSDWIRPAQSAAG